jgi:hypothetical protein
MSGWSSPRGLAGISKLPYLLLLSRSQLGPFGVRIVSIHDVGLLVNLRLGNKSHLAFVRGLRPLAPVRSTWDTPAPAPTVGNRGYLPGLLVIGRVLSALELNVSVFHRVKSVKLAWLALIDAFTALREGSLIPSLNQRVLRLSARGATPYS